MTPTSSRPARSASRALPTACGAAGRGGEGDEDERPAVPALRPFDQGSPARKDARRGRRRAVSGSARSQPAQSCGTLSVVGTVGSGAVSPTTVVLAALLASLVHQIAACRSDHRDDESQKRGPDPVAGIPAQAPLPAARERRDDPAAAHALPALEAVLLEGLDRCAAARAGRVGRAHESRPPAAATASASTGSPSGSVSSGSSGVSSTGVPQLLQNRTSAGSGAPQRAHATTGRGPAGRPQFWQKCAPHGIGAPHSQRRPASRRGGEERVDLVDAVVERGERPAALGHELDAEPVEPEHLVDDPAEVAHELLALTDEGAALALERAGRGARGAVQPSCGNGQRAKALPSAVESSERGRGPGTGPRIRDRSRPRARP